MSSSVFDGIWDSGRVFTVFDGDLQIGRKVRGFLEPLSLTDTCSTALKKPGIVMKERYRLISEPKEAFLGGTATRIRCGAMEYEVLSIKEVYHGEEVSHRECVLRRTGEAGLR